MGASHGWPESCSGLVDYFGVVIGCGVQQGSNPNSCIESDDINQQKIKILKKFTHKYNIYIHPPTVSLQDVNIRKYNALDRPIIASRLSSSDGP